MLDISSTQAVKAKSKRQQESVALDDTSNYSISSPAGRLSRATSRVIEITPAQPPVHLMTEKYKSKKVFTNLLEENLDFEVTIYFPKKFEALRKFYCGSHEDFIKSIMKTNDWADNSGGKQKGNFFKSGDQKYVFKEIRPGDIRMFTEFAPRYFDYLCKSFFHNFP